MTDASIDNIALDPPNSAVSAGQRGKDLSLIFIVVALLGLFAPGASPVYNELESGFVLSVQEMARDGGWLVPTLNERPRTVKPPLPVWIGAAVCEIAGEESAPLGLLRGISAVVGFISAVCLYLLGLRMFDRRAALWSALAWSTCFLVVVEYRLARHDIYLTASVIVAMLGIWKAWKKEKFGWTITAIGLILAFQCKGPVSWMLTVLPAAGFAAVRRPVRWRFIGGLAVWALVAGLSLLPWIGFILMDVAPSHLRLIFWEAFGRIASGRASFDPPWFYLAVFGYVLPWSGYLLTGLVVPFEQKYAARREPMLFAWWWLVGGLVLLTIPFEKTERYAVPLIAPAALLIGQMLSYHLDLHHTGRSDPKCKGLWYGHGLWLMGLAVVMPIVMKSRLHVSETTATAYGLALSVLAMGVTFAFVRRRPDWATWGSLIFAVAMCFGWTQIDARAPINHDELKARAEKMSEVIGEHEAVTWPYRPLNTLMYYANRTAPALGEWYMMMEHDPDLTSDRLNAILADKQLKLRTAEPILEKYLQDHRGRMLYIITSPEQIETVERFAKPLGFAVEPVMDLTTRQPGEVEKTIDPLLLLRLSPQ